MNAVAAQPTRGRYVMQTNQKDGSAYLGDPEFKQNLQQTGCTCKQC